MRTLIVSDVHLGAPGRLLSANEKLVRLLGERWDQVIFAGDLFDLWVMSYRDIKRTYPEVIAAVDAVADGAVYVPGNHDSAFRGAHLLDGMAVALQPFFFEQDGKRIAVFHGDHYDPLEKVGWIPRILTWIATAADRFAQWVMGPGVSLTRSVRYSLAASGQSRGYGEAVAEGAVKDADGADIVVAGHTHLPSFPVMVGGSLYVNSGDFGPEHMTYVVIEGGTATLHTVA